MGTKRRRKHDQTPGVTAEAIAHFRAGNWIDLHRALGLRPWEASPLDVERFELAEMENSPYAQSFAKARALRKELASRES